MDGDGAGEVGVEGGLLGVHRGFQVVIHDATMNALVDQEAKPSMLEQMAVKTRLC